MGLTIVLLAQQANILLLPDQQLAHRVHQGNIPARMVRRAIPQVLADTLVTVK